MMFVLYLMSIILAALISFEEQQNGLYDMLLSITAVYDIWENRVAVSIENA